MPAASSLSVLIVDDQMTIRSLVRSGLQQIGVSNIDEAADGEQAVAMATELKPDVAILDVKMPRLDGISAAGQIMAARICPVVMLTAFSQLDLVERAREAGATGWIVKPFKPEQLMAVVKKVLG